MINFFQHLNWGDVAKGFSAIVVIVSFFASLKIDVATISADIISVKEDISDLKTQSSFQEYKINRLYEYVLHDNRAGLVERGR